MSMGAPGKREDKHDTRLFLAFKIIYQRVFSHRHLDWITAFRAQPYIYLAAFHTATSNRYGETSFLSSNESTAALRTSSLKSLRINCFARPIK